MEIEFTNLTDILERIEQLAPQVLEIYQRQVYANIVEATLWTLFFIGLSVALFCVGMHYKEIIDEKNEERRWVSDSLEIGTVFSFLGSGILLLLGFFVLTTCVKMLVNPDYYALTMLLDALGL